MTSQKHRVQQIGHAGGLSQLVAADHACGDVCDGAPGTQAVPDGGNGGVIYGDGGAGWTSTQGGVAGGDGAKTCARQLSKAVVPRPLGLFPTYTGCCAKGI